MSPQLMHGGTQPGCGVSRMHAAHVPTGPLGAGANSLWAHGLTHFGLVDQLPAVQWAGLPAGQTRRSQRAAWMLCLGEGPLCWKRIRCVQHMGSAAAQPACLGAWRCLVFPLALCTCYGRRQWYPQCGPLLCGPLLTTRQGNCGGRT